MKKALLSSLGLGNGQSHDQGSLIMIVLAISIFWLALLLEFFTKKPGLDWFSIILGIIFAALGWSLRVVAHDSLGRQFRIAVKIIDNHQLITEGVHSYLRHPMYTGMFLFLLGFSLIFSSSYSIGVLIFFLLPIGIYRTFIEENALKKHFGRQYTDYCRKTRRFVPYLF